MTKLFVKALPVNEIIKNLSEQFQVPVEDDCGELCIFLPDHIGEGFIRGISFESGIGYIEYKCTFYKDLEIHFTLNKTHPLKFIFCSEGRAEHSFEKDNTVHSIFTYQNIIVSSSKRNGHVLYFKANETVKITSLEIIRSLFIEQNPCNFENLDPQLSEVFQDSDAGEEFFYQGNYSIKSADIVEEVANKEITGFLRYFFLQAKVFEMLVLQIMQYQDDQREDKLPQILRRSDVEKVRKAIEIIEEDLSKNHSVDYLAKEVGTNVNKLQEGFKYLLDLTVNKYVQQVKLEKAKEMLALPDYNISQVVNLIGLNNRSYFAKIFKEKYGVSPKYFLKAQRDKSKEDPSWSDSEE